MRDAMSELRQAAQLAIVDCETTGLGKHDRIVEIAVVLLDPITWETTDEYDTLINPERDVGPVGVHGITATMVEAAPVFGEVAFSLSRKLHGSILVAHNLAFDARMLRQEFDRLGIEFDLGAGLCTLRATREKLIAACQRHGICLDSQHRALADARATATLARKVLNHESGFQSTLPAAVGHVHRTLGIRTLRRETLDAGVSEMARVVSLCRYPSSDENLLQYLDALDWVLDDSHIDEQESAEIAELAATLGISSRQRDQAHRAYLRSIIAAVERDGIVTESEHVLITRIADNLGISDLPIPDVTDLPPGSGLRADMRVCFTGSAIVQGVPITRGFLETTAAQAGMQPVGSVTKKNCDVVVAADSSSQSGKARKARKYGIPVVSVEGFLSALEKDLRLTTALNNRAPH